ncbi:hypothetical protein C8J57DRAFT_1216776 [Mycena rebaudengoi]|nr:hypothetical protein C8J57DRAFT_1216776 [Mycena rebaudengoi]
MLGAYIAEETDPQAVIIGPGLLHAPIIRPPSLRNDWDLSSQALPQRAPRLLQSATRIRKQENEPATEFRRIEDPLSRLMAQPLSGRDWYFEQLRSEIPGGMCEGQPRQQSIAMIISAKIQEAESLASGSNRWWYFTNFGRKKRTEFSVQHSKDKLLNEVEAEVSGSHGKVCGTTVPATKTQIWKLTSKDKTQDNSAQLPATSTPDPPVMSSLFLQRKARSCRTPSLGARRRQSDLTESLLIGAFSNKSNQSLKDESFDPSTGL